MNSVPAGASYSEEVHYIPVGPHNTEQPEHRCRVPVRASDNEEIDDIPAVAPAVTSHEAPAVTCQEPAINAIAVMYHGAPAVTSHEVPAMAYQGPVIGATAVMYHHDAPAVTTMKTLLRPPTRLLLCLTTRVLHSTTRPLL